MEPVSFHYKAFGLNIRSDLAIPELTAAEAGARDDIQIRLGSVAAGSALPSGYTIKEAETFLHAPGVGSYRIRAGSEIVVDPEARASERDVRLFLLGSAMGALLHQRGLLPLHANAIDIGGRAVAFCGPSGAGKSTLAAWFQEVGHRVLADDVCVVAFGPAGGVTALPGIPRLRLWRGALDAFGRTPEGYQRSFDDRDKYDVPTETISPPQPAPLAGVYLLESASADGAPTTPERLSGVTALDVLMSNTYRGDYVPLAGLGASHLQLCLKVAGAVPVFRVRRAWGFDRFEDTARQILKHANSLEFGSKHG